MLKDQRVRTRTNTKSTQSLLRLVFILIRFNPRLLFVSEEDLEKLIPKLESIVRILTRLCTEDGNDAEIAKLVISMQKTEDSYKDILVWATRFGYGEDVAQGGGKKRRKKA